MAKEFNVDFWGTVPIDPSFVLLIEGRESDSTVAKNGDTPATSTSPPTFVGTSLAERYGDCPLCPILGAITKKLVEKVEGIAAQPSP